SVTTMLALRATTAGHYLWWPSVRECDTCPTFHRISCVCLVFACRGGLPASTGTCTTSAAKGSCGPYTYPQIQGNPSEITVGQNLWNPISGWQQALTATDPGSWQVTANMPDKNTAVISSRTPGPTTTRRSCPASRPYTARSPKPWVRARPRTRMPTNEASGSVDIKAIITWLENNGYMPQNSTVTALSYGFEIASTGGQNQTFRVSNFSITP